MSCFPLEFKFVQKEQNLRTKSWLNTFLSITTLLIWDNYIFCDVNHRRNLLITLPECKQCEWRPGSAAPHSLASSAPYTALKANTTICPSLSLREHVTTNQQKNSDKSCAWLRRKAETQHAHSMSTSKPPHTLSALSFSLLYFILKEKMSQMVVIVIVLYRSAR